MRAILRSGFLALAIMLAQAVPANAGPFEDGVAAHERGDYATALRLWRLLAEQGGADAQYNLGFMYRHGRGVPQDDAEAVKWYRKAAEQGHAEAQINLGGMYRHGRGVPQDNAEAVKWYRKAAEQGHAKAQHNLGLMYVNGLGVPQDDAEAVKWFRKAAEQGHAIAQFKLGLLLLYNNGRGVLQDNAEAIKWLRKALTSNRLAAERGDAESQSNLGKMYRYGWGVPQDYVSAHMWFNLAAAHGYGNAQASRKKVAEDMSPDQIAEAQRMAREWMVEHQR